MGAGVNQVAAWRRDDELEAAWPGSAPTNPGAGHRIPIISEGVRQVPDFHDHGALFNQVSQEASTLAGFRASGPVECDLRYGDLDRMYAAAMGFENPNTDAAGGSPHNLASGEERHVYECHQDLRSLVWQSGDRAVSTGAPGAEGHWLATHRKQCRGGFYVSKGVSDWRLWPAMVESMEFDIQQRASRVTFQLVGRRLERGSYGSASYTSFGGQDYNDDPGVAAVQLHHLTAKYGTAGASSWTNANMAINQMNLKLVNGLKADDFDASSGQYILEPWRNGQRMVTGSFVYTRYADDAMAVIQEGDTQAMFQFIFDGPSLGTNQAQLCLGIPACKITKVGAPVTGPGIIQQSVEFQAHATEAALGTVWQGVGEPFENVTLTLNAAGKPGELLLSTLNAYSENVFEND